MQYDVLLFIGLNLDEKSRGSNLYTFLLHYDSHSKIGGLILDLEA